MREIEKLWADRSSDGPSKEIRERTAIIGDPASVVPPTGSGAYPPGGESLGYTPTSSPESPPEVALETDPVLGDLRGIYCRTVSA